MVTIDDQGTVSSGMARVRVCRRRPLRVAGRPRPRPAITAPRAGPGGDPPGGPDRPRRRGREASQRGGNAGNSAQRGASHRGPDPGDGGQTQGGACLDPGAAANGPAPGTARAGYQGVAREPGGNRRRARHSGEAGRATRSGPGPDPRSPLGVGACTRGCPEEEGTAVAFGSDRADPGPSADGPGGAGVPSRQPAHPPGTRVPGATAL